MTWAAAKADRRRLMTLTLAADDWQRRRWSVNALCRELRRDGRTNEWAWSSERGSKTGMLHVHALQWGDFVPQAALQQHWGAIADVRALSRPGAGVYAVKEALRVAGYAVKGATEDASGLADHLALNGGRVAHWTRGFLHGETRRSALAKVRESLAGGEPLTWVLVPG